MGSSGPSRVQRAEVAALWATSGEKEGERNGRLGRRRGRCEASGVDRRGWERRCRLRWPRVWSRVRVDGFLNVFFAM
jgi:hypothetical protein